MVTVKQFVAIALSFPNTECNPHFDRMAFKVTGKRIFATLLENEKTANIVFTKQEQQEFCKTNPQHIYPVPNKWGEKGWTTFELHSLHSDIIQGALVIAYENVFKKDKK